MFLYSDGRLSAREPAQQYPVGGAPGAHDRGPRQPGGGAGAGFPRTDIRAGGAAGDAEASGRGSPRHGASERRYPALYDLHLRLLRNAQGSGHFPSGADELHRRRGKGAAPDGRGCAGQSVASGLYRRGPGHLSSAEDRGVNGDPAEESVRHACGPVPDAQRGEGDRALLERVGAGTANCPRGCALSITRGRSI